MKRHSATSPSQTPALSWSSAQLIGLSQTLAQAYGGGLRSAERAPVQGRGDRGAWTTAQLLQLSAAKCL